MNIRPETIKLLEENIGSKCLGTGLDEDFLDLTLKARQQSKNKQMASLLHCNKMKRQTTDWEKKYLQIMYLTRGSYFKTYKELKQHRSKEHQCDFLNGRRILTDIFPKKRSTGTQFNRCSTSLVREMQIKTIMRYQICLNTYYLKDSNK